MTPWPAPSLRHVARLTDDIGTSEFARLDRPRPELGYCTDDAGRALALASRLPADPDAHRIATSTLGFLQRASTDGSFRLRCGPDARWTDDEPSDDATGRALLGLGTAAARAPWPEVRATALGVFEHAAGFSSPHPRARAYAALGAVEVLAVQPNHCGAAGLLVAAADLLSGSGDDPRWRWIAPRLTYANAVIPDAALAVAARTGSTDDLAAALGMLEWLVTEESHGSRFSFTPVGGRGPGDPRPGFDQQPIEASAMADACARAFSATGDIRWARSAAQAARWFLGHNDTRATMFDPTTGGGFDGLHAHGVNENQGAESTLAFVGTMALVHQLRHVAAAKGRDRDGRRTA